jgi:P27 family predicted phage terminase small subunit
MKTTGPRPKPIKLRILEGNRSHRPIPKNAPEPSQEMPFPPSHLDIYALEEWNRVAGGLNAMGVLTGIDQGTLAAYCGSYSRWRKAEEELAELAKQPGSKGALVMKTISGNYIQNPLIGISNKAAGDMVRYAVEFGMTPSARARLAMEPDRQRKGKFDGLIGITGGKP